MENRRNNYASIHINYRCLRGSEIKATLDQNLRSIGNTWPVGNLGGISLVKRQGRETTREIKTPKQSRLETEC